MRTDLLRHLQQACTHLPPLFYKNAEIKASPSVFATMQKYTHLLPLFFKNAEINASSPAFAAIQKWTHLPPSLLQKCGNQRITFGVCNNAEIHTSPPSLFFKNAEINGSCLAFTAMRK
jgi:hypothetical protein